MDNKEILEKLIALSMQLQEEFLKEKQDFEKQRLLNAEFVTLKREVLSKMGNKTLAGKAEREL